MGGSSAPFPAPSIRAIRAAMKRHRDVEAAAAKFGTSYAVLWATLYRHGTRLPYRRDLRRIGFIEALRRFPNDRYAQAQFVGLTPRQFRASALRFGLIRPSGETMPGALEDGA